MDSIIKSEYYLEDKNENCERETLKENNRNSPLVQVKQMDINKIIGKKLQ